MGYCGWREDGAMRELLEMLWRSEEGQDLTEYALIVVLISLVAVVILRTIGTVVFNTYSNASSNLTAAAS
jgi:Flp pilus assembly pilin Flp